LLLLLLFDGKHGLFGEQGAEVVIICGGAAVVTGLHGNEKHGF
jgi:hypothetical protein